MKNLKVKVQNMTSSKGSDIPNQFIIDTDKGRYFQSYDSIIVFECSKTGKTFLDKEYWNYSVTTGKYRNIFLGENKKETERKIDEGIYKLIDLN